MTLDEAMQAAGFDPPSHIEPGKTIRFSTNGKTGDKSGWVYLFADGQCATFGCWRTGEQHTWQAERTKPMRGREKAEFRKKLEQAKQEAKAQREIDYKEAATKAKGIWEQTRRAPPSHAYLTRKQINPDGLRLCVDGDYKGWLVAPVYGPDSALQSLQFIAHDGVKRFMTGGRMKGGHCWQGDPNGATTLILAEGWATAASLHQASGLPVCVVYNAGNLADVARMVRNQYPAARLLIAGDDDTQTEGNPGRTKATEAAQAVGASVAFPPNGGDFNDMAQAQGLDVVRVEIDRALGDMVKVKAKVFHAPCLPCADARDGTTTTRPLSELGNAARLIDAHGENIRYVWETKAWLLWRDGAWEWNPDGAAIRGLAAKLPAQIYAEGAQRLEDAEHFAKWARQSQKERTLKATVSLLEDAESVRLPLGMVDARPFLIGLDRCRLVLDLKTGKTRPATQGDFITKALNVERLGDPAKAVRWNAFLAQVFGDDPDLTSWLKRWCGYLLTGSTREQIFLFCFGLGANGKSVFAETVRHVMGDYARAIAAETLTESKRQAGSATPDLAALIGARLALSSETEDARHWLNR